MTTPESLSDKLLRFLKDGYHIRFDPSGTSFDVTVSKPIDDQRMIHKVFLVTFDCADQSVMDMFAFSLVKARLAIDAALAGRELT